MKSLPFLSHGHVPRLRTALAHARVLGCRIEKPKATGEVVVISPDGKRRCRVNNRRDDASLELIRLLRAVEAKRTG